MHRRAGLVAVAIVAACGFGGATTSGGTGEGGSGESGSGTTDGGPADTCAEGTNTVIVVVGGDTGSDTGGDPVVICYCMPGTTWVDPFDPHSFDCAPLEPRPAASCDPEHGVSAGDGLCRCADLYTWCAWDPTYEMPTEDTVFDVSCCLDPAQDPDFGGTSTGDGSTGETSTGETSTGETSTGDGSGSTSTGSTSDTSSGA